MELKFLWPARHPINVLGALSEWKETKNPFFVDAIQLYCAAHDLTIGPILNGVFVEVAATRFDSFPSGTPEKVKTLSAKNHCYKFMLIMVYHGVALQIAASKAAKWHSVVFPLLKPLKASTLEKYYEKQYRGKRFAGLSKQDDFESCDRERLKASALEKYNVEQISGKSFAGLSEQDYFESWDRDKKVNLLSWEANRAEWLRIIDKVPLSDEEQTGYRR